MKNKTGFSNVTLFLMPLSIGIFQAVSGSFMHCTSENWFLRLPFHADVFITYALNATV
jgi:hypothetical protein